MRSSGHIQGAQPGARHFTGTGARQGLRKGNAPRQFASHRRHDNAPRQCAMTLPAAAPAPGVRSTNGFTAGTGGAQLHGAVDAAELHQPLGHDARVHQEEGARHVPAHATDHQRQRQARPGQRAAARSRAGLARIEAHAGEYPGKTRPAGAGGERQEGCRRHRDVACACRRRAEGAMHTGFRSASACRTRK
ncbi:hypothetical protein Veis_2837 [Verminephrobacter eiseniae EF01-2]|uniref:Uncharacterized protein n=1 Tax=Verminephrobacter eiseniae (strain EF01-2) TaxID=391735 RepID=A1WLR8_VEREI|nr:hypothetical protein Veis_2837 [Verminephrobacter eiseniae EF01-2]